MITTYHLAPGAHLMLAIEALKFAMEQKAVSAETRRKIGVALASARRDLARLKPARKSKLSHKRKAAPPRRGRSNRMSRRVTASAR